MAIKVIDTRAREIIAKPKNPSPGKLKLFFKTAAISFLVTLGILAGVLAVLAVLLYPKAKTLAAQVENTYAQAKKVEAALEDRDVKLAERDLKELKNELADTQAEFKNLSFIRFVPIAASYYSDGEHLLKAASLGVEVGEAALVAVDPFGDVLGFKGYKESLTAEAKAEKIVKEVLPNLTPLVDEISEKLVLIEKEVGQINETHYPQNFEVKGFNVRKSLRQAKEALLASREFIPEIKPLLLAAPDIAGEPDEKVYLILLQNDKELRSTGGFITSYALARVKGGRLLEIESDDIYQLDLKYRRTEVAPEPIKKYLGHNSLPIRDSNLSPDFKLAALKFETMYNTIPKMPKVDGIFALDTEFVRTFLEVTGPITTKKTKETFSAEKNRLGIPDVVYKLELHAEKINAGKPDRKGILGELMDSLIDKVLNAKTEEFPKYIEALVKTVEEKHFLFYFHNSAAQEFAEKYNAAGRIKDFDGDYFHLNNSNFGGLKGNLYIKTKVEQDIQVAPDGEIVKKVDVTLTNPARADGWLNSIYLNWMRLYVPEDSTLISKKVQKDFTSSEELSKEVYRGYGATYPLNFSVSTFTYKLPFKLKNGQPYKMMIQKQPGVEEVEMIIKINGVEKEHFMLRTDRELEITI
ncbi:MAG TPA: DUF4012 domain-containing protein [Candidatus Nanoarchaeia archaeon]|nr:hypothetical protein [uncultured archaeon]